MVDNRIVTAIDTVLSSMGLTRNDPKQDVVVVYSSEPVRLNNLELEVTK